MAPPRKSWYRNIYYSKSLVFAGEDKTFFRKHHFIKYTLLYIGYISLSIIHTIRLAALYQMYGMFFTPCMVIVPAARHTTYPGGYQQDGPS